MTTDEIMKLAATYCDATGPVNLPAAHDALRTAVESLVAERGAMRAALFRTIDALDGMGDECDGWVSPIAWKKHDCRASIDAARAALKGKQ